MKQSETIRDLKDAHALLAVIKLNELSAENDLDGWMKLWHAQLYLAEQIKELTGREYPEAA